MAEPEPRNETRISFTLLAGGLEFISFFCSQFLDASVSPHYRLGIGINNGFIGRFAFGFLIENLAEKPQFTFENVESHSKTFSFWEQKDYKRLQDMLSVELSTMYLEHFCDYISTWPSISFSDSFQFHLILGSRISEKHSRSPAKIS